MDQTRYRNTYLTKATRQAFEMLAKKTLISPDSIIEEALLDWLCDHHPDLIKRINALTEAQAAMETEILNSLNGGK